jgi:hypothetical protein
VTESSAYTIVVRTKQDKEKHYYNTNTISYCAQLEHTIKTIILFHIIYKLLKEYV